MPAGLPSTWQNEPEAPLEQTLHLVVVGFIVAMAYARECRKAREEAEHKEWQEAEESRKREELHKAELAKKRGCARWPNPGV